MNNNKDKEELFKNAIDGLDIMKITYISFYSSKKQSFK